MTLEKTITVVVLVLAVAAFIREWVPMGLTALAAPLLLVVAGVLEPAVLWSKTSDTTVIAVGAMFVIAGAVSRTGALGFLAAVFERQASRGHRRTLTLMMLIVAVLSAVTNNTTVVLVFLPIVLGMCERLKHAPSRYLIPLSYASIFGGMTTLIGTSTNILVAEQGARAVARLDGERSFDPGLWDFAPVGLLFVVTGIAYMVLVGHRLLPNRAALSMTLGRGTLREYVTEAEIMPGSSLSGDTLADLTTRLPGLRLLQVIRDGVLHVPRNDLRLRVADVLLVKGKANELLDLGQEGHAALLPGIEPDDVEARAVNATLAELIVPPRSRVIGRRIDRIGLRARHGISVVAIQRHGQHLRQKVGALVVEPADMLLVQGSVERLRSLRDSDDFILVEGVEHKPALRGRAPVALAGLGAFVVLAAGGWFDVGTSAALVATGLVFARCLTLQEAFASVDWGVLAVLFGSLALGDAVEQVGLARDAGEGVGALVGDLGPLAALAAFYLITTLLTDTISNGSAAALMVPVVVRGAAFFDVSPEPFLMAVAFAASAAFLSPVGYQTNLLVYGPGGYRFRDFLVVGLPLRLVFWILAVVFVPIFHPF